MTHAEAIQEVERLKKMIRRDIEMAAINCDCDYWPGCPKCIGSGTYYEIVYAFCGHVIDAQSCDEDDCEDREYKAFCERERNEESEVLV